MSVTLRGGCRLTDKLSVLSEPRHVRQNRNYCLDAETSGVSGVFIARGYLRSNAQNRHPFHHLPCESVAFSLCTLFHGPSIPTKPNKILALASRRKLEFVLVPTPSLHSMCLVLARVVAVGEVENEDREIRVLKSGRTLRSIDCENMRVQQQQ